MERGQRTGLINIFMAVLGAAAKPTGKAAPAAWYLGRAPLHVRKAPVVAPIKKLSG
jgi:hypothetical protein